MYTTLKIGIFFSSSRHWTNNFPRFYRQVELRFLGSVILQVRAVGRIGEPNGSFSPSRMCGAQWQLDKEKNSFGVSKPARWLPRIK